MTAASTSPHTYLRDFDGQRSDSLSVLASMVPAGARVLDVGTGGGALGRHLAEALGCSVDGVTHNPEEQAIAACHYRRLELADLENRDLAELFAGEHYQAVICADVLEHLRQPEHVLAAARRLLAPGGRLLLSVPNVGHFGLIGELLGGRFAYRPEGLLDATHLRFFTRRSLLDFLARHGWQATRLETIRVQLRESEFQVRPESLPPAVLRRLLELPDALTYQFVVEARPLAEGETADQTPFAAAAPTSLHDHAAALYWHGGEGYDESHKLVRWGRVGEPDQDLEFPVPDDRPLAALRLDPADRGGFLHLGALRLLGPGDAVRWQWDGSAASLQGAAHHQIEFGRPVAGGLALLMAGDDAWLELPVPADVLSALPPGSRLQVRMSWPLSADFEALADRLRDRDAAIAAGLVREGQLRDQASRLEGDLRHTGDRLRRAEDEEQRLAAALTESRGQTAWVREERDQLQRHLQSIEQSTLFRATRPLVRAKMALDRALGRGSAPAAVPQPAAPPRRADEPLTPPDAPVDVIVPVYRGLGDTRRCLESVLASTVATPYRLVAIFDAGPEPQVLEYLRALAATEPRLLLLENERNLGFVATVNRGMALATDRDVLLLNSDTEVANDWLDRLRQAAYGDRRVGSVTPLSNNATICSYPRFCRPNELPEGLDTGVLDRLCAATNPGQRVDVPTGVGFCMYIRRDCLDQVGLFDVERFGLGYGEENDFCMRALDAGWRHLLALDTFVLHTGGVSFGDAKKPREIEAFDKLRQLHPRYEPLVREHVAADPARGARLAIDAARLRSRGLPTVLFVTHARGGGTERHVRELADALQGIANALVLRPSAGGTMAVEWLAPGAEDFRLFFRLPGDLADLCAALAGLGVVHLHFHHLLGLAPEVWGLPERLGVSFDYTAHDHYALCPQISLTGRDNRYCGERGLDQCDGCLRQSPAPGGVGIVEWRRNYRQLLRRARHVFAPSRDTARRLRREFPEVEVLAVEHPDLKDQALPVPCPGPLAADAPLRVAVIGALSVIKGADVLEAVALEAARADAPVEFHLLGYGYRNLATQPKARLTVHGQYEEADLPGLLDWLKPDLVWFPALWPETYSYTLSACLQAGLPVVAPDLGAFPERLGGRAWSWVTPWDQTPGRWLEFFAGIRSGHFVPATAPSAPPAAGNGDRLFCYRADYPAGLARVDRLPPLPGELLAGHAYDQRQGVDAAQAEIKRATLGLLVRLRNARLLRGLARRIPLRWQTRVKTWLTS